MILTEEQDKKFLAWIREQGENASARLKNPELTLEQNNQALGELVAMYGVLMKLRELLDEDLELLTKEEQVEEA